MTRRQRKKRHDIVVVSFGKDEFDYARSHLAAADLHGQPTFIDEAVDYGRSVDLISPKLAANSTSQPPTIPPER